jgi:hypothetical protein
LLVVQQKTQQIARLMRLQARPLAPLTRQQTRLLRLEAQSLTRLPAPLKARVILLMPQLTQLATRFLPQVTPLPLRGVLWPKQLAML